MCPIDFNENKGPAVEPLFEGITKPSAQSPRSRGTALFVNLAVVFSVTDHGKGIDEKYLPKIFDRYFKVPGTQERTGTGLGLSISKEFIEAQNGHIWATSQIGEGSRFNFSLPAMAN